MNFELDDIRTACLETSVRMRHTLREMYRSMGWSQKVNDKWGKRFAEEVNRAFTENCAEFFLADMDFSVKSRQVIVENLLTGFDAHEHFKKSVGKVGYAHLYSEYTPQSSYQQNPQKLLVSVGTLDSSDDPDFKTFEAVLQTVGGYILNNTTAWDNWKNIKPYSTVGDFRDFFTAAMQSQPEISLPHELRTAVFHQSLCDELMAAPIEKQSDVDNLIERMKRRFGIYSSKDKHDAIEKAFERGFYLLHLTQTFQVFFEQCRCELETRDAYFINTLHRINNTAP